ncbi:hypothetical protein OJF2_17650 [Aquisphaera giovannonii]|uniref:Uncharacterized protein n=1 Tax=Aquisphaera giovannonii TaxID=406548 RepID=A0A5B9VZQ7_9BACT|nr:hypothetical protein [Aquisphaera giovannonii]QEH33265.1 hypothetical protein OJF2_17650 [Aquisphaera giovannonii]
MAMIHQPETGRAASPIATLDPSAFAERLRGIALDTHRLMKGSMPTAEELLQLERRIDDLRAFARYPGMLEINRWLDNARIQVERKVVEDRDLQGLGS